MTEARTGQEVQSAAPDAAKTAGEMSDFPHTFLPRGLPLRDASSYSGLSVRLLWKLIAEGKLAPVRVPGCRRGLLLREHLDALLSSCAQPVREEA